MIETETIRQALEAHGRDDLVVINTCAVTAEAVRQAKQAIRRAHRDQPQAQIIVTGCAAQSEPETFAAMPEVAQVIGNDVKLKPETWARDFGTDTQERVRVNDIMAVRETAAPFLEGFDGHTRAFVQVQTGCDHRCTFCVIPFGRGNSRSVPMGDAVTQIARLVERGYREVVLTGIDITSYGADLPGAPKLGRLVKHILRQVPHLQRLRISSIDSVEADDDLIDALANDARMMPHLHLSLQAGDDLILKRMKRRHSRADAVRFCERIRKLRPDIVFGADLIAGFPTESEEMFAQSLALIDECGLTHLHVFPYSPRRGTPAAKMPQVPRPLIKERASRLRAQGEAAMGRHLAAQVGRTVAVLMERGGTGRMEDFTPVQVQEAQAGELLLTQILSLRNGKLLGAPVAHLVSTSGRESRAI
ncbi:tRNA (N(6)-L-threonylcarbamoyladenosine(37)-C(2))-methylthiotransferase MtaB [Methylovirgula sp. 4M-Z18]|nr:tRNA (N(6)-L-threonylcarbamoyladenosine(37)-C(2))-methylthiotransferase MtaB [Methylovirgula sp. 4M-Z18]